MRLEDALFNWLQIKIVTDARDDDDAAVETKAFFETMLREDHGLVRFDASTNETFYIVSYETAEGGKTLRFDRDLADRLLADINANPRFNGTGC